MIPDQSTTLPIHISMRRLNGDKVIAFTVEETSGNDVVNDVICSRACGAVKEELITSGAGKSGMATGVAQSRPTQSFRQASHHSQ